MEVHYEKRDPRGDYWVTVWEWDRIAGPVWVYCCLFCWDGASDLFLALNRSRPPDIRARVAGLRLPKEMNLVWLTCAVLERVGQVVGCHRMPYAGRRLGDEWEQLARYWRLEKARPGALCWQEEASELPDMEASPFDCECS